MKLILSLALVALAVFANGSKVRYDGYRVERITPQTPEQLQALKDMERLGVSFWEEPTVVGRPADVMFPPHTQGDLLNSLRSVGMKIEPFVEDVQTLIDVTEKRARPTKDVRFVRNQYNSLDEIFNFLDQEAAASNGQATVETIGQSFEGRPIKIIRVSNNGGASKPIIFLDANIHAREWITNAVANCFIDELVGGSISSYLDNFDFVVLPVLNPDGYEYTRSTDRLWRKTRSTTGSPLGCRGADPNRNYGFHWLDGGSSTNPCSDTYAGGAAFSEVENQAVRDYITSISGRLVAYISLHSYSQYLLLPFGHTATRYPQFSSLLALGNAVTAATASKFGTQFVAGNIVDLLYVASGGSMDWVKGTFNTNVTFTYELRDSGRYGFLLPPEQIEDSCLEFIDGFNVIVEALVNGVDTPDLPDDIRAAAVAPVSKVQVKPIEHQTFGQAPVRRGVSPLEALRRH